MIPIQIQRTVKMVGLSAPAPFFGRAEANAKKKKNHLVSFASETSTHDQKKEYYTAAKNLCTGMLQSSLIHDTYSSNSAPSG